MIECKHASYMRVWDLVFARVVGDGFAQVSTMSLSDDAHKELFDRAEYIADRAVFEFIRRAERWTDAGRPEFKPRPDGQSPRPAVLYFCEHPGCGVPVEYQGMCTAHDNDA